MPSTKDLIKADQGVFCLGKGDSGSGKTVGFLSWPNAYVFDFDKKMPNICLKHFPEKEVHWDTFESIFDVQTKMEEFWNHCPYETLIFDSLTALVVMTLNSISKIKGDQIMEQLKRFQLTSGGGKQIELMGYDYYNGETRFIEQYWLEMCKNLYSRQSNPKNVFIVAHVMTAESAPDIKTKIVTVTRRIVTAGRNVAAYIPTVFDDVWHFAHQIDMNGQLRRKVLMQNTGTDFAKTSFMIPGNEIDFTGEPPDFRGGNLYEKFIKKINGDISL